MRRRGCWWTAAVSRTVFFFDLNSTNSTVTRMVTAKRILRILRAVDGRGAFLHRFLEDGLGWPIRLPQPLDDEFTADGNGAESSSFSVCFRPISCTGPSPPYRVTLAEFTSNPQSADGLRSRFECWRRTVRRRFRSGGHLVLCTDDWHTFAFALLDDAPTDGPMSGGRSVWIEFDPQASANAESVLGEFLRKLHWTDSTEPGAWQRQWQKAFDKRDLTQRFLCGCRRNRLSRSDPFSLQEFVLKQILNSAESTSNLRQAETGFVAAPSSQNVAQPRPASESPTAKRLRAFIERFPFTLHEDTSQETFLAIGPGILAELHETGCGRDGEAPETDRRKRTGSYFTPPVIADFMVREALCEYLSGRLAEETGRRREDCRERLQTMLALPPCDEWNDEEHGLLRKLISFRDAESIQRALQDCRICDPAVGAGALLLSVCREMTSVLRKLTPILCERRQGSRAESEFTFSKQILDSCLHGIDVDAEALRICKLRLSLMLLESWRRGEFTTTDSAKNARENFPDLDRNLIRADALLDFDAATIPQSLIGMRTDDAQDSNGRAAAERDGDGFDIVLANPPYRSFGLRGNRNSSADWAAHIRRQFPESAEYKISLYSLFFELGLNISSERGVLCYLTPDSFLLGRYFSKLRKMLLGRTRIRQLVTFADDFWTSGIVGRPTISLLQKVSATETAVSEAAETAEAEVPLQAVLFGARHSATAHPTRRLPIRQQRFREAVHYRFRLFFSETARDFAAMMESQNRPLNSLARITSGIRSRCGQRNVIAAERRGDKWKRGLISGSQVKPFRVEWRGHYLHIDCRLLFAGGWDAALIERPKILIRQTGDSLIAAVDTGKHYHLNNLHALIPFTADVSLPFLCAVLNSRMMNRYYHLITLEKGRALAQTDIETLDRLPIGFPADELVQRIEQLSLRPDVLEAREEIESLVENCYDPDGRFRGYLAGDDLYPLEIE
ncbi:MAG: Eco57I restriction-modification methylase domain-containing protein [Planctomycetes bacterium]|nr:Eco57I restriction-modification methylase domain-containing protein [Planctomycetota bacterium]